MAKSDHLVGRKGAGLLDIGGRWGDSTGRNHDRILMYNATTRSIEITVKPKYLEDQSEPSSDHYVWAYSVRIENHGGETVQLCTRHWRITDAAGRLQEVHGDGVSGEQPILHPGETFEYTSGSPLSTPSGIMNGSYEMETEEGVRFDVEIPAFSLDSPYQERLIH